MDKNECREKTEQMLTCIKQKDYQQAVEIAESIDWKKVKQAGVDFAMIRLGFRSSSDGIIHMDANFKKNLRGAKAARGMQGLWGLLAEWILLGTENHGFFQKKDTAWLHDVWLYLLRAILKY